MNLPLRVPLFHDPSGEYVEAHIVTLTKVLRQQIAVGWWDDPAIDSQLAATEIDRHWDWEELQIEFAGKLLRPRRLAIVTGEGAVQGAVLMSRDSVECELEAGKQALFVELLFVAPRNRRWLRRDGLDNYKGVGMALLRAGAQLSMEAGFGGRLKLDASPDSVSWYKNRGLLEVSAHRIVHEDVEYTPMELMTERVSMLLTS